MLSATNLTSSEDERNKENVTGETYRKALESCKAIRQRVLEQNHVPMSGREECEKFAKENHLDFLVYSDIGKKFNYVNHVGEQMTSAEWAGKLRTRGRDRDF